MGSERRFATWFRLLLTFYFSTVYDAYIKTKALKIYDSAKVGPLCEQMTINQNQAKPKWKPLNKI
jgi:hypothetical protein